MADLISRSEAIDAIKRAAYWQDAERKISELQSVDVAPVVHGRWRQNENGTYSCDRCQSWIPNEQHHYARYCLYCGAKMDEQEAEW